MKTIQIEIPDGKRAEWINGVLTLVDDKPIEYKFKVGDRVLCNDGAKYKITGLSEVNGMPGYSVLGFDHLIISEANLVWIVQDITERIKTFNDAVVWCTANGKKEMAGFYAFIYNNLTNSVGEIDEEDKDFLAYLKLRIITCALNEGWEPTFEGCEERWLVYYRCGDKSVTAKFQSIGYDYQTPKTLLFKSKELALYAATQFADIYADFCGCEKGGEK